MTILTQMTDEECFDGFDEASDRLRLEEGHDLPTGIIPQATHVCDLADDTWRAVKIPQEAKALAYHFGGKIHVVVMPPFRVNERFTPGHYFANRVTVLVANKVLAKGYTIKDGVITKCADVPNVAHFSTFTVLVKNLDELMAVVDFVSENMRNCCIIRGHCIPLLWDRIRRRKEPETKPSGKVIKPTFVDAPLIWSAGDIDGLAVPEGLCYCEPNMLAEYARASLPPEVHDVRMFYKLSSSAVLGSSDKIKTHVYWWNKEPITSHELKAWSMQSRACAADPDYEPVLDRMLPQTVQIHFTSLPTLYNDLEDPLEGRRMRMLDGSEDAADMLPACEKELAFTAEMTVRRESKKQEEREANPWLAAAYSMGGDRSIPRWRWDKIIAEDLGEGQGGERGLYGPIWRLVQTAVDNDADEDDIVDQIGEAVRAKHREKGSPRDWVTDIENYCSDRYLGRLIKKARQEEGTTQ